MGQMAVTLEREFFTLLLHRKAKNAEDSRHNKVAKQKLKKTTVSRKKKKKKFFLQLRD